MLSWVDEACWIAASLDYPECQFVTVGMDKVEFHHGVEEGVILEIDCQQVASHKTSVTYEVKVSKGRGTSRPPIFSTQVSFVNVDKNGNKRPL